MWSKKLGLKKRAEEVFVRQQDQSDCGVACLLSIINFFGGQAKLERLRELSGTTQQGTTLLGLYQSANEIGLHAEAYEADLENLQKQTNPCILHIVKDDSLQHYIIFYGTKGEKIIISDPAEGIKLIAPERLKKIWKSRALLLLKPSEKFVTLEKKKEDRWKWIRQLIKRDLNLLGLALVLGVFVSVLSLATAIFSQKLIDDILPAKDTFKLEIGLGLLVFLLLAKSGLSYVQQLFLIRQSKDFNKRIINLFYSSLLRLPVPFFFNRKAGDLIARMNDTRRLQKTITYLFSQVMIDVLLIIVASVFILSYSVNLGLIVLMSVPLFFLLTWWYNDPILEGQRKVMEAHSANESNYVDTIQGIAPIKTGNREPLFAAFTKKVYGFFQKKIFDLGKVSISFTFWTDIISTFCIISVLSLASVLVLKGRILIGAFVAIFQMANQIIPAANRLALTNIKIQEARVALDRMYEFTSLDPEHTKSAEGATEELKGIEEVNVSDLSFRFPGSYQLLKEISFEVQNGEMIALLGESGCGKTTILQILQRFYEPGNGRIMINEEIPWQGIPVKSWRSDIASVPQHIKIFNGTLLENIRLGELAEKEAEQIINFCKEYGFDTYFEAFPQQYDTILGEEGANISGGQQQLVALARALYQQPDLLLLDEATSAMDRTTEQEMLQLLMRCKHELGIILVTHRVQSVKCADRIYILEDGEISTKGSPERLSLGDNLFSRSLADISVEI